MKKNEKWSRLQRVHSYCDICKHKDKCSDWCFGDLFEQSTGQIVKQSLISKVIAWIKGDTNVDNKS